MASSGNGSSSSSSSKGLTSVRVGGSGKQSSHRRAGLAAPWLALALLLLAAALLPGAMAKVVSGKVALNNATQWVYLTKFSYSLGSGNFTLDVKPVVRVCRPTE